MRKKRIFVLGILISLLFSHSIIVVAMSGSAKPKQYSTPDCKLIVEMMEGQIIVPPSEHLDDYMLRVKEVSERLDRETLINITGSAKFISRSQVAACLLYLHEAVEEITISPTGRVVNVLDGTNNEWSSIILESSRN